jgi:mono/diheme cytochrome c family protein
MSMRRLRAPVLAAALSVSRVPVLAAAVLMLGAPAASAQSPVAADSGRSVTSGAYTSAQAAAGETTFGSICGSCHGPSEFSGPAFRRIWSGRTVYDLFDQLRASMPLDNPGGLSREQYTNVIAYLLKLNKYPDGDVDLPASDSALRRIRFD